MKYKHLQLAAACLKFDDQERTIEGYASVFNGLDAYGDTIAPGAYANTIGDRERPVRMRWNHYGPVIGKWTELREDERGLYVKGTLTPGHSVADDVYASLKHGAVDGLSIAFHIREYEEDEDRRLLKEFDLVEISVVEEPADLGAKISGVKTSTDEVESIEDYRQAERLLMENGFSKAVAVALIGRLKSLASGDPEPKKHEGDPMQGVMNWRLFRAMKLSEPNTRIVP